MIKQTEANGFNPKNWSPDRWISIVGALISTGVLVVLLAGNIISSRDSRLLSIDNNINAIRDDNAAFRAEAAADRQAFQASMDDFKKQILGLTDRQSRLEGVVDTIIFERYGIDGRG